MTANAAGYALQLLAGRWLGVAGYGEFASLLAVQLMCAVPALALQNVVARELVRGAPIAVLRRLVTRCALLVAVAAVALVPVVTWLLQAGVVAAAGALAAAPLLVLISGGQGILQGGDRFRALALVLAGTGVARVVPAVFALAIGRGAGGALWATAAGYTVAAVGAYLAAYPADLPIRIRNRAPIAAELGAAMAFGATKEFRAAKKFGAATEFGVATVLRAAQVQAALMALSSADLIVARVVLDGADAGRYALGAIAAKIAFWLPQAIGVVLYPRMAQPDSSARAIRDALGVLSAVGAVAVVSAAALAPLAPLLAGRDYAPIEGLLWLFALDGALLALLQGALLSAIAVDRTALATVTWIGLVVEVVAQVGLARSPSALIGIATAVAAVVTTVIIVVVARSARRIAAPVLPAPVAG
ncbi:polysaccharide biosynthesis protein [Nocardia sp. alder85J]|nr:polysaccharide biosynthesis protein [Nocardia sp. alder85J]MCX4096317.1 polysaccharide biosynthesis protein [Nocardia sp. alder85J]